MVQTQFQLIVLAVVLFFGADGAGQPRVCFWLKIRTVRLVFQKCFLVLLVRFLWRRLFQVVSLSRCFETTPDLSASKHIKFVVRKV